MITLGNSRSSDVVSVFQLRWLPSFYEERAGYDMVEGAFRFSDTSNVSPTLSLPAQAPHLPFGKHPKRHRLPSS